MGLQSNLELDVLGIVISLKEYLDITYGPGNFSWIHPESNIAIAGGFYYKIIGMVEFDHTTLASISQVSPEIEPIMQKDGLVLIRTEFFEIKIPDRETAVKGITDLVSRYIRLPPSRLPVYGGNEAVSYCAQISGKHGVQVDLDVIHKAFNRRLVTHFNLTQDTVVFDHWGKAWVVDWSTAKSSNPILDLVKSIGEAGAVKFAESLGWSGIATDIAGVTDYIKCVNAEVKAV